MTGCRVLSVGLHSRPTMNPVRLSGEEERINGRTALWQRLLGRSASEAIIGRLCHGDGATSGVPAAGGR